MKFALTLLFSLQILISTAFANSNDEFKKGDVILYHARNEIAHMQVTHIEGVDSNGIHTSYSYTYDERNIVTKVTVDASKVSRLLPLEPDQSLEVLLLDNSRGTIQKIFSNGVAEVEVRAAHRSALRLFYLEELRRLGRCETLLLPEWQSLISTTQN